MKVIVVLLLLVLGIGGSTSLKKTAVAGAQQGGGLAADTLLKISARPAAGFNFDYLLYLPRGLKAGEPSYLVVETNNTGLNDSIAYHERRARHAASISGVGNYVAKRLQLPLLVPVFPRSATDWKVYTHALDRDAFFSKGSDIERLDLQLLAMVEDAKKQLASYGYPLKEKFFITGFSASGTFANRFSLLHPEKIKATAAGGINAIPILPVVELEEQRLPYPLGIADIAEVTGKEVNLDEFSRLPKMLFMGALDDNDAVAYDDGYNSEDRELVYHLMGKQLVPQRWEFVQEVYRQNNIQADFRTYPAIGHGTDKKINEELVAFFRQYVE